jgi:hypothetical protein
MAIWTQATANEAVARDSYAACALQVYTTFRDIAAK